MYIPTYSMYVRTWVCVGHTYVHMFVNASSYAYDVCTYVSTYLHTYICEYVHIVYAVNTLRTYIHHIQYIV